MNQYNLFVYLCPLGLLTEFLGRKCLEIKIYLKISKKVCSMTFLKNCFADIGKKVKKLKF